MRFTTPSVISNQHDDKVLFEILHVWTQLHIFVNCDMHRYSLLHLS